jgi:hypothetical protein
VIEKMAMEKSVPPREIIPKNYRLYSISKIRSRDVKKKYTNVCFSRRRVTGKIINTRSIPLGETSLGNVGIDLFYFEN